MHCIVLSCFFTRYADVHIQPVQSVHYNLAPGGVYDVRKITRNESTLNRNQIDVKSLGKKILHIKLHNLKTEKQDLDVQSPSFMSH